MVDGRPNRFRAGIVQIQIPTIACSLKSLLCGEKSLTTPDLHLTCAVVTFSRFLRRELARFSFAPLTRVRRACQMLIEPSKFPNTSLARRPLPKGSLPALKFFPQQCDGDKKSGLQRFLSPHWRTSSHGGNRIRGCSGSEWELTRLR